MKKYNYEILFKDSPEHFIIENARMFQEDELIRFVCFNDDQYIKDYWYPTRNIYRIKRVINEILD